MKPAHLLKVSPRKQWTEGLLPQELVRYRWEATKDKGMFSQDPFVYNMWKVGADSTQYQKLLLQNEFHNILVLEMKELWKIIVILTWIYIQVQVFWQVIVGKTETAPSAAHGQRQKGCSDSPLSAGRSSSWFVLLHLIMIRPDALSLLSLSRDWFSAQQTLLPFLWVQFSLL